MSTCFVYTCDHGYLLPALVSAAGARAMTGVDDADVLIMDFSPPTPEGEATRKAAAALGVRYLRRDPETLEGLPIAYARLLLHRVLPPEYDAFIYVDSDTQVWGRLDELARAPVPEGRMLASRDPMTVMIKSGGKNGDAALAHMRRIGFPESAAGDYINSGMFKVGRDTWATVSAACLDHLKERGFGFYRYFDQDVINLMARDRIDIISFKWNYPGFLLRANRLNGVEPRLVHFMSNPRPWHGPFYPWGEAGVLPYRRMVEAHPDLADNWPRLTPVRYLKYLVLQAGLAFIERPYYGGRAFRENFRLTDAGAAF